MWIFGGEGVKDFLWESSNAVKSMVISRKCKKACVPATQRRGRGEGKISLRDRCVSLFSLGVYILS